jgi:hypothetical protein
LIDLTRCQGSTKRKRAWGGTGKYNSNWERFQSIMRMSW